MKRLMIITLLIVSLAYVSCSKDEVNPSLQSAALTGSWKYIGYSGGIAGIPFTPQDTVTYFLQFDASKYTSIRNNTQGCGTYTFEKDTANFDAHIGILTLSGESLPNAFDTYVAHDTLTLYPHGSADAFSYSFVYSLKQFDWCEDSTAH